MCENRGPANYNVSDGMSGDVEVLILVLRTLRCSKYLQGNQDYVPQCLYWEDTHISNKATTSSVGTKESISG